MYLRMTSSTTQPPVTEPRIGVLQDRLGDNVCDGDHEATEPEEDRAFRTAPCTRKLLQLRPLGGLGIPFSRELAFETGQCGFFQIKPFFNDTLQP